MEDSYDYSVSVNLAGRITGPPRTIQFFAMEGDFGEVTAAAEVELRARGWKVLKGERDFIAEGPEDERVSINGNGFSVKVVFSRNATFADRTKDWFAGLTGGH